MLSEETRFIARFLVSKANIFPDTGFVTLSHILIVGHLRVCGFFLNIAHIKNERNPTRTCAHNQHFWHLSAAASPSFDRLFLQH